MERIFAMERTFDALIVTRTHRTPVSLEGDTGVLEGVRRIRLPRRVPQQVRWPLRVSAR